MSFKEHVEKNVVVWLAGTLLTGFIAGFGTYDTIQQVLDLQPIARWEVDRLKDLAGEKPQQLMKLKEQVDSRDSRIQAMTATLKKAKADSSSLQTSIAALERDNAELTRQVVALNEERQRTSDELRRMKDEEAKAVLARLGKDQPRLSFALPGKMIRIFYVYWTKKLPEMTRRLELRGVKVAETISINSLPPDTQSGALYYSSLDDSESAAFLKKDLNSFVAVMTSRRAVGQGADFVLWLGD